MTKRVNIYLEAVEMKQLLKLKEKYHLSISTIANIIARVYMLLIPVELQDHYIYGRTGKKTSIKPRQLGIQATKLSVLYTNVLKMFLKKDIKKFVDEKTYEKTQNMIYKEFEETWDDDWNGSLMQRLMPKYMKQNKEYYKKVLGVEK